MTVEFDQGKIFVNDRRIDEDYLQPPSRQSREHLGKVLLHAGDYYVLGDNTGVSKDSRSFGPVHDEHVVGKAVLRFWPPNRISLLR